MVLCLACIRCQDELWRSLDTLFQLTGAKAFFSQLCRAIGEQYQADDLI